MTHTQTNTDVEARVDALTERVDQLTAQANSARRALIDLGVIAALVAVIALALAATGRI